MNSSRFLRAAGYAAALSAIALAPFTAGAQTASGASSDEITALREQIRLLDQKLKTLERNLELKDEAAAAEAKKQPKLSLGDRGLSITSADKAFTLRVGALVQTDFRYFANDDADTGRDGFLFRRVRPTLRGTVNEKFDYRITPDFAGNSGSDFALLDATVTYNHSPEFAVTVGKFKAPFDLERLQGGGNLTFIERAYPTILGPNREVGVLVGGSLADKRLSYAASIGNGTTDGGSTASNSDDALEGTARLFATPFVNDKDSALAGLGFGVAVSYGDKTSGAPRNYSSNGQQTIFSWDGGPTGTGKQIRFSPQASYYYGPFGLLASYVSSRQELQRAGGTIHETFTNEGWLVSGSYVLTGEKASYNGVTPANPFKIGGEGWGAFEIAARVSSLDLDDDIFTTGFGNLNSDVTEAISYGVGLNWYLTRNVKAVLNYELSKFDGGAAGGNDRQNEHAIFSRLQLNF
jgi:Phosphate-selective porin